MFCGSYYFPSCLARARAKILGNSMIRAKILGKRHPVPEYWENGRIHAKILGKLQSVPEYWEMHNPCQNTGELQYVPKYWEIAEPVPKCWEYSTVRKT